tara:strand:- start:1157 stop:1693 length:537 start_codon:yes stop_codon:yes gene_type:complete
MNRFIGSQEEFLTDHASYFLDKKSLYLEIKKSISEETNFSLSMIRICGSAYWGKSFKEGRPFTPGVSDLDVAIIDANAYVKLMSETRTVTKGFTDLTEFPAYGNSVDRFKEYAIKKGIILTSIMPRTKTKRILEKASDTISRKYIEHFSKISFLIYDTDISFTDKQAPAFKKFNEGKI